MFDPAGVVSLFKDTLLLTFDPFGVGKQWSNNPKGIER